MGFLLLPSLQGFEAAKNQAGPQLSRVRNDHRLTLSELEKINFSGIRHMSVDDHLSSDEDRPD